ncbi:Unconventional myosin-XIX [Porites harrisoni]
MKRQKEVRGKCLLNSVLVISMCWRRNEKRLERRANAAVKIQSVWRGWNANRNFKRVLKAVKVIQHHTRKYLKRQEEARNKRLINSVLLIQKCWRRHQRRRENAAVKIQSVWRGWNANRNFKRVLKAVKVIQHHTRKYLKKKQEEAPKKRLIILVLVVWKANRNFNRSSGIISCRYIEKVPVKFHCRVTAPPYAYTRPLALIDTGLAGIREKVN